MAIEKSNIVFLSVAVGLTAVLVIKLLSKKSMKNNTFSFFQNTKTEDGENITIQRGSIAELTKNPLNLTVGSDWVKRIGGRLQPLQNTAQHPKISRFERFDSYYHGLRAGIYQILRYIRGEKASTHKGANAKLQTIEDIITEWAPANENNTAGYISAVEKQAGVKRDKNIAGNDKAILSILKYMAKIESGFNGDSLLEKAYYSVKNLHL